MTGESDIAFFEFPNPLLHRSIGALNSSELVQFGADWRAGALTIRQLCDRWQLALTDVLKLGDRYGARAVREEYRLRLATGLLDPEAALGAAAGGEQSVLPRDRSAAVDRAVGRAVEVVGAHKVAISGARQLTEALVAELSVTTVGQAEMSEWCTIAAEVRAGLRDRVTGAEREAREGKAGDAQQATFARALAMFEQLISLPSRADSINKMAGALAKLVVLERQAYQIADDPGGNPAEHVPLEERLRRYAESGSIAGVIDVQAIAS